MLFLTILFGIQFLGVNGVSYLCTGLHAQINITDKTTLLMNYQLDLTYDATPFGYETMNAFNTQLYTVNNSFSASELSFYSEVTNKEYRCPSDIGNCTLTFIDGGGLLRLAVGVEGVSTDLLILDDVTYFKGTVFWDDGMVLRPDDACITGWEWVSNIPNSTLELEYCCNRWETLPDSSPVDNTCLEYTSDIAFSNDTMTLANLRLIYQHFVGSNMTINGVNFTSGIGIPLEYIQSINYGAFKQCVGTTNNPQSSCYAHLYDPETVQDSEFAFFIDIYDSTEQLIHWHSVAGAFEFRNGILMRNGSDPFTPDKPCTYYNQGPIGILHKDLDDGVSSNSSFCCTKWQNPVGTTTIHPQSTTTKPSSGSCSSYNLTLIIANNTNFDTGVLSTFNTKITVGSASFDITPNSFTTFENRGNYDLFYFYNDFDSYNCRGSTTNLATCSLSETDGKIYQLFFSTSFGPDGFPSFNIQASNGKLVQPDITPSFPCATTVTQYNYPYPPMFLNSNICCNT